jgi:hypothetical protein
VTGILNVSYPVSVISLLEKDLDDDDDDDDDDDWLSWELQR